MAYSRKQKRHNRKSRKHYKKTYKTYKKGGSCGCSRITGGGGSPYLSDLSPQTYYAYNPSIQNDPNNHQLSTRMAGVDNVRAMTGGRRRRSRKNKNKKQKKIVQRGGLSYSDFNITSLNTPTNDAPSFLHNMLSTNQPNPNIPMVTPGIKYYV